jgi:glycosyltransferase involved in cell wall biosynthesis
MKKVLIICPYPDGKAPSQRFRFEQYLDSEGGNFIQASFWKEDEWPRIYRKGSIQFKVFSTIKGFGRRLRLLFQVRQFDKVFVHREATPIGPPWFEWAVTKLFRKPLIFDFDDAIWLPNSSKANEKLAGKLKFHGKTAKICSWATTVVAGNDFLADYARRYCNDVRIIPTTIDTERHHNPGLYVRIGSKWVKKSEAVAADQKFEAELLAVGRWTLADKPIDNINVSLSASEGVDPTAGGDGGGKSIAKGNDQEFSKSSKNEKQLAAKSQQLTANSNAIDQTNPSSLNTQYSIPNTILTIGWTGTHSTLKQLIPLFPLLDEVHREIPFRFLLIADIPPANMPDFVEFRKWKKETEIEDLLEMDIGVMPLYHTDWERGKCGFKALQYQALGIPAVVSAVGVNTEVVKDGETGFICEPLPFKEGGEWKHNLSKLLESKEMRLSMGGRARLHILQHYSVLSQKSAFADLG